ncbi:MAG: hypothetical protein JO031_13980, partial [Ktedonobacteraceae bacterium]|nr:hypothetical protein [Ktedonobacteraceae bacterium]
MSKMTSTLTPSHAAYRSRRWGIRSCLLVFFCISLLLSNVFNGWGVTAHAAARPNPNPPLSPPSWLHAPAAARLPDLRKPPSGNQNASNVSIPRPHPKMPPPLMVSLTTGAQRVLSRDGNFELDIAAGSVSAAQIQGAGGAISLKVVQLDAGSGGDVSGRVFLGTYQIQLLTAQGKPLTTLVLAHPFTFRYHAPKALQGWLWQDQHVYAIWQPSTTVPSSVKAPMALPSSQLLLAHKDAATAAVWSVTTGLHISSQATHTSSATPVPNLTPAAASSTITFNTEAPTASWGKAKDVDVGLSSGSLNDTYPLSVPPGPGSLTPP